MSNLKQEHSRAMDLAEEAIAARLGGNSEKALALTREAFYLETSAVEFAKKEGVPEPTLSVLQRSAATLAAQSGMMKEAQRLAYEALRRNPPREIVNELEELLETVEQGASGLTSGKTVLGSAIEVRGDISFSTELLIDGHVMGDINSRGILTVGENARIEGNIWCPVVTIFGTIMGDIVARKRCELKQRAALFGDIQTGQLVLQEGATFVGRSELFVPTRETPPSPAASKPLPRERERKVA
jgi:cytoskeletal protein CcmA (bactofilin family)